MRTITGLTLILLFVWITMLASLVVIFAALPFLTSKLTTELGRLLEQVIVAGLATIIGLVWLTMWRELAFRYFSRILTRNVERAHASPDT